MLFFLKFTKLIQITNLKKLFHFLYCILMQKSYVHVHVRAKELLFDNFNSAQLLNMSKQE